MTESVTTCPLCGNGNACGMASGSDTCWCTSVLIASSTLAQVPAELKDKVCICQSCATKPTEQELTPLRRPALPLVPPQSG